ncbi:MAG: hypothetical protein AAFY73_07640 [Pseudomonadota bacterium]
MLRFLSGLFWLPIYFLVFVPFSIVWKTGKRIGPADENRHRSDSFWVETPENYSDMRSKF